MIKKSMTKKFFCLYLVVNFLVIISCISMVYAISNSDITIVAPSTTNGFYMQGNSYSVQADVNNNPTSVKFYCPESNFFADFDLSLSSGTRYTATWIPNSGDNASAQYVGGRYTGFNQFEIAASNSSGTGQQYKSYHVPVGILSTYTNVDNQFSYQSPTVNDFDLPNTGKYNCAAYAVDVYDQWFNAGNTLSDAVAFMTKQSGSSWANRSGTTYTQQSSSAWCKVIYYNGVHFAKVTGWDAYGNVVYITSKWGNAEVIDSDGANAFESTYGSPAAYFY